MMREHAGLAAILGTGPGGEAPVYSGAPPLPERMPSVSVEVTTAPDARLSPPGRHEARIEVWVAARTHAEADAVSSALDELLASGGSATVAGWTVKRVIRERATLRAETRPHEGGRGLIRRIVWTASVDPS
jgi:hypothetical protein